jgi:SAM-dependent methyltransferase
MSDYYADRLGQYGPDDVRSLGWGSVESQQIRFKVLAEIADLRGHSVLDFGCGFGDLYNYLFPRVFYIGCDSNLEMLEVARRGHPGAVFVESPVSADYVLASGAFNLDPQWQDTVVHLWSLCRLGMAVNFTSSLAQHKNPDIIYVDPFNATRFCSTLTRKFTLRHDYKPNDFTIYLHQESQ